MKMENIKFNQHGLVPAVIQDVETGTFLMLAYMSEESLKTPMGTGYSWFSAAQEINCGTREKHQAMFRRS